jgi:predicted nuclease with TOPRIM domain
VAISLKTGNTQTFVDALDGVTSDEILECEDLKNKVRDACAKFSETKEVTEICRRIRQASEAALSATREKLTAFERGKLSLDDLFSPQQGICDELAAYYDSQSKEVTPKMKLPISRCLASLGRDLEAARLA